MSVPVITFFNNKGGVGKTSLVYHLSWMFSEMGKRVLALDLDPQANLTAGFLEEDQLEALWGDANWPNHDLQGGPATDQSWRPAGAGALHDLQPAASGAWRCRFGAV